MQTLKIDTIEIPINGELKKFFVSHYKNKKDKFIKDILIYLNTKKEALEINEALKELKNGKTRDINELLNEI